MGKTVALAGLGMAGTDAAGLGGGWDRQQDMEG